MNTRFPATTKGISKHCFVFENHSKVLFNIVSEASYVHILSQQKFLKNALNGQFWRGFKKPEACGQTVVPDRSILIGQKLMGKAKNQKFK